MARPAATQPAAQPRKSVSFATSKTKEHTRTSLRCGPLVKSSKTDTKPTSAIQRPVKKSPQVQHNTRSEKRKIVSAAAVFKKTKSPREKKSRHNRYRSLTPEKGLLYDFQDGIEIARSSIASSAEATFDSVHEELAARLFESRTEYNDLEEIMNTAVTALSTPLPEEQIETTVRRDGKRVTEIVKIGDRLAQFKVTIETEEVRLKDYWKQWEELQNEYLELGISVFGHKVFGEDAKEIKIKDRGFKKEMELLDLDLKTRVDELDEEIRHICSTTLQKTKSAEREQDSMTKKEQTRMLQTLMQAD